MILKKVKLLVTLSCPALFDPMDYSLPGFSVHGLLPQEYWSGLPCSSLGHLPNLGMEPGFPALQTDSLPSQPRGKPNIEEMTFSQKPEG